MKIGIVGGTGNISQSIVRLLLEQGHEVVCFNRGQTADVRAFRGVGGCVQTSTVCTYGINYDYFPSHETHPWRPITGYGAIKLQQTMCFWKLITVRSSRPS